MSNETPVQYKPDEHKLIVTIVGGLVQEIEGGPAAMGVEVWDFDVEGTPEDETEVNAAGDRFLQIVIREGG